MSTTAGRPGGEAETETEAEATGASDYERLRAKKKARRGNEERGEVREVEVRADRVVVTVGFDWAAEPERLVYDLDDDRDLLKLEALAESKGFEFEQLEFLEGEPLAVVYTGAEWVPTAHRGYAEGEGSARETFAAECRLLARELARSPKALRRLVRLARTMTARQLIIAVVVVKKLAVVALVAWLVL